MARKNRTAVLKRQRERKKAEKAELKRAQRDERKEAPSTGQAVASTEDLDALGLLSAPPPAPHDD